MIEILTCIACFLWCLFNIYLTVMVVKLEGRILNLEKIIEHKEVSDHD